VVVVFVVVVFIAIIGAVCGFEPGIFAGFWPISSSRRNCSYRLRL
jgi:hypothetical protein